MTGFEFCEGYWWIFPMVMILLCFFFMRKCGVRGWCMSADCCSRKESAMDILNRRYAQGDIDQTEYEERKKRLEV